MNPYYSLRFLKEFTEELIRNSVPLYLHEKIKEEEKDLENIQREIIQKVRQDFVISKKAPFVPKQPIMREAPKAQYQNMQGMTASIMPHSIQGAQTMPIQRTSSKSDQTTPKMDITRIQKEYPGEGIYLGEIEKLVNDPNVSSIDCPGPEKFVSVKVHGMQKVTRIQIDKQDINAVLDSFSRESRIPRIGGIFKAISNNLVLTAIDTDIAGPRFIITKTHPQGSSYL